MPPTTYYTWKATTTASARSQHAGVLLFLGAMTLLCVYGISSQANADGSYVGTRRKVPPPSLALSAPLIFIAVYSVTYDINRNIVCSGSMDGTVRIWDLYNGQCRYTLSGHTSLVGLLSLSSSYLVSGSADSTIRVWKLDTGDLYSVFAGEHKGAVTCLYHDDHKLLAGRDGSLEIWDLRTSPDTPPRKMLDVVGVWQVVCKGKWCAAGNSRGDGTMLDIWDLGNEGHGNSDEESTDDEVED